MATAKKQSAVKTKSEAKKPAAKLGAKESAAPAIAGRKPAEAPPKAVAKKTVARTDSAQKAVITAKKVVAKPAAKAVAASKPATAKLAAKSAPASKPAAKPAPVVKAATKPVARAPAKPAPASKSVSEPMPTTSKNIKKPASQAAAPGIISEEQLLKMSDKDYMNEAQLAFFKYRLQTMKDEILVNARETGEHLKENEAFADPNDRATVEEENMLEQRVRDRERKLLKKIDASLRRIDEGDYGFCLETGDPIGLPRLLARPTADLSIEAQEKHERREKLYAD